MLHSSVTVWWKHIDYLIIICETSSAILLIKPPWQQELWWGHPSALSTSHGSMWKVFNLLNSTCWKRNERMVLFLLLLLEKLKVMLDSGGCDKVLWTSVLHDYCLNRFSFWCSDFPCQRAKYLPSILLICLRTHRQRSCCHIWKRSGKDSSLVPLGQSSMKCTSSPNHTGLPKKGFGPLGLSSFCSSYLSECEYTRVFNREGFQ